MALKKVIAIFDESKLNDVTQALMSQGINAYSITDIRGRGAYFNSYSSDPHIKHIELIIYTSSEHAEQIAVLIMNSAHINVAGEGLVSIESVDKLFWIHDRKEANESEFHLKKD